MFSGSKCSANASSYYDSSLDEGLEALEPPLTTQHLMLSQIFADRCSGKKSILKRRIIVWLLISVIWIHFIKYFIIYLINKPWIWTFFGDPLFGKSEVPVLFLCITSFMVAVLGELRFLNSNFNRFYGASNPS